MDLGVQMARFESNSAGGRVAQNVQEEIKKRGGFTKITTKFNTKNKETRILVASAFVKEHFLFKDSSLLADDKEYREFMQQMCGYTLTGKNKHDDAPDALAMLVEFIETFTMQAAVVMKRPF